MPTAAGHLMQSLGTQSFPILMLGCTLANLILFKPVLIYGERVRQTLAKVCSSTYDAEDEMQGMIVKQEAKEQG